MSEAGEKFAQEFVISFGFLGGIWLKVGVSPEGAIAEAIVEVMKSINGILIFLLKLKSGTLKLLNLMIM